METESILYRTLWLFGGTFIAAMLVLATIIWWVSRKGRNVVPA
jgi:preprotein translocase subunit SecG